MYPDDPLKEGLLCWWGPEAFNWTRQIQPRMWAQQHVMLRDLRQDCRGQPLVCWWQTSAELLRHGGQVRETEETDLLPLYQLHMSRNSWLYPRHYELDYMSLLIVFIFAIGFDFTLDVCVSPALLKKKRCHLLGYRAVYSVFEPTFWRNVLLPSSWSKINLVRNQRATGT
jgi:hypothetical protein